MHGGQIEIDVLSREESMFALQSEWDDLWRRLGGRFQDSFGACRLAWERVARPAGAGLSCVVGRSAGQAVLIWPLICARRFGLTILKPLGPDAADETVLLAAPGPDVREWLAAGWRRAVQTTGADLTTLPFVAEAGDLHRVVTSSPGLLSARPDEVGLLRLPRHGDWDAYVRSLSAKLGGSRDRRLAREGVLRLRQLPDPELPAWERAAEAARMVDWMLTQKRLWAERVGKHGPWLSSPSYQEYLVATLEMSTDRPPRASLMLLELDGRPVAGLILGVGETQVCAPLTAFDPHYARFSPGTIMFQRCTRWALEHGLDYDLGPGGESYKSATGDVERVRSWNLQTAHTSRGRLVATAWLRAGDLRRAAGQLRRRNPSVSLPAS